jgi:hypothetical protein
MLGDVFCLASSRLCRSLGVLAFVLVFAAVASPAVAKKRVHHRHRHPARHLITRPPTLPAVVAQEPSTSPNGFGVLGISGSTVHLVGTPLDNVNLPYSVGTAPGIMLSFSSASVYASAAVCAQRGCSNPNYSGWTWIPADPTFLRNGDNVIIGLAVRSDTADADLRAGLPVPVSWIYDNG